MQLWRCMGSFRQGRLLWTGLSSSMNEVRTHLPPVEKVATEMNFLPSKPE